MFRYLMILRCVVLMALAAGVVTPANAYSEDYTTLNLVGKSDLIVVGKVTTTTENTATVKVSKTLFGRTPSATISISPVIAVGDMGSWVNLKPGDEIIAMLISTKTKNEYTIAEQFHGKIALTPQDRSDAIYALERIIKMSAMSEDSRIKAMLSLVTSDNKILRQDARWYVGGELSNSKLAKNYSKELIALLKSKDLDLQGRALSALSKAKVAAAIPEIIRASRDVDLYGSACWALKQYDTPETAAALIALSYNNNTDVCTASMSALRESRRPEVKKRLIELLGYNDPKIRGFAISSLMNYLQRGEADEALPRMLGMLDDPAENVQESAAREVGESRNPIVIEPLLDVLRRPNLREQLELRTIESLNVACGDPKKKCAKIIADNLPIIIEIMERGHERADTEAAKILAQIGTPEAIAALKKAADSAPREENRLCAKRLLETLAKEVK
ncbi:MAG: hypothetical protein NT018_04795 [Armatimonadetes bacterium]|nr:hypothetical protein [Armatimonadota bacterium]